MTPPPPPGCLSPPLPPARPRLAGRAPPADPAANLPRLPATTDLDRPRMSPRRRQQAPRHGCESVAPGNQAACGGCWVTSGPLAAAPQQLDSPDAEASEPSKLLALLREPRLAPPPPLPRNQGACFPAQVQHPQQLGSKATWTEWRAGGGGGRHSRNKGGFSLRWRPRTQELEEPQGPGSCLPSSLRAGLVSSVAPRTARCPARDQEQKEGVGVPVWPAIGRGGRGWGRGAAGTFL